MTSCSYDEQKEKGGGGVQADQTMGQRPIMGLNWTLIPRHIPTSFKMQRHLASSKNHT